MKSSNKTILITGSGSGIGKAAAITLAQRGHTVLATTESEDEAIEFNALAQKQKLPITSFKLDITNPNDRLLASAYNIDVLINNAGIGESGSLAEIDVNKVRHNFEVNVFAPLELTQIVLKGMMTRNSGTVIFISSLLGRITMPFLAPYSMTKFSLSSGAEALRQELKTITKNVHISIVERGSAVLFSLQDVCPGRAARHHHLLSEYHYRRCPQTIQEEQSLMLSTLLLLF